MSETGKPRTSGRGEVTAEVAEVRAENAALRGQLAVKEQKCVTLRQLLRDAIEAARC